MTSLKRQLLEDRALRDAALALVRADIAHLKGDFGAKSMGARFVDRISEGAVDVFEEAVDVAEDNKGVLATLIAAVILWFARNPILALLDDDPAEPDERDYHYDEDPEPSET